MDLAVWQVVFIMVIAFIKTLDYATTQIFTFNSIVYGALVGLALGDLEMGLLVGGTIQLMSLGIASIGGSSVPDYPTAAIIATTLAISTGQGMEAGLAIGLPVGMLGVQLDVMVKIMNGFIARKSQQFANEKEFKKMQYVQLLSPLLTGLSTAIPVGISIILGKDVVMGLLEFMPEWFTGGLIVAGKILPVVGIATLLRFMPVPKYIEYVLIGFVLSAYLKVPILGVAIIGFALAYKLYKERLKEQSMTYAGGMDEDE